MVYSTAHIREGGAATYIIRDRAAILSEKCGPVPTYIVKVLSELCLSAVVWICVYKMCKH